MVNMKIKVKTQVRKNALFPCYLFPDGFVSWQEYGMIEILDVVFLSLPFLPLRWKIQSTLYQESVFNHSTSQ